MSKTNNWSADYLARKNSTSSKPVIIYEVHLGDQEAVDNSTYFFNSSNFNFDFYSYVDGSINNYVALGIEAGGVSSSIDFAFESINVILDNVSRTFSTLFNQIDWRGKKIVIRQIYADLLTNEDDYDLIFVGVIDSPEMSVGTMGIEARHSILNTLNLVIPKTTYFNQCNNKFTDSKCANGVTEATLEGKETGQTIDSVTNQVTFVDSARTEANTYYVPGIIEMTGGTAGNIGLKRRIVAISGTTITIETNFPNDIEAGDEYSIERDCDKTFEECKDKFSNDINFRGFRHLPNTLKVTQLVR